MAVCTLRSYDSGSLPCDRAATYAVTRDLCWVRGESRFLSAFLHNVHLYTMVSHYARCKSVSLEQINLLRRRDAFFILTAITTNVATRYDIVLLCPSSHAVCCGCHSPLFVLTMYTVQHAVVK